MFLWFFLSVARGRGYYCSARLRRWSLLGTQEMRMRRIFWAIGKLLLLALNRMFAFCTLIIHATRNAGRFKSVWFSRTVCPTSSSPGAPLMPSSPPHRARYAQRPAVIVSLAAICTFIVIGRSTTGRGVDNVPPCGHWSSSCCFWGPPNLICIVWFWRMFALNLRNARTVFRGVITGMKTSQSVEKTV
jgi:hypothetical protein